MPDAPSPQDVANFQSKGKESSGESLSSGGEDIDFKSMFGKAESELKEARDEITRTKADFDAFKTDSKKTADTVEKMRAALLGDDSKETTPDETEAEIAGLEAEIDQWANDAWNAQQAGKPITKTAKLAIDTAKARIKMLRKAQEYDKKIKEIDEKANRAADPEFHGLTAMYDAADQMIEGALQRMYGNEPAKQSIRNVQMAAIQKLVGEEFTDLQKNDPESWARVKRDRVALGKLVEHFVLEAVPPAARKMIEDDKIRRTPMGFEEYLSAFREAKADYEKKPTPQKKALLQELKKKTWDSYASQQVGGRRQSLLGD